MSRTYSRPVRTFTACCALLGAAWLTVAVPAWSEPVDVASPADDPGPPLPRADRCLRAAELRNDDETTRTFYRQAAELAEKALQENPNSAHANFLLFAARGRMMMADGAVKNLFQLPSIDGYLRRALELDPQYAHALAAKGGMLLDLPFYLGGDAKEAEQVLRHAVARNPTGPGTLLNLARALLRNGDANGARQQLLRSAHYACLERRSKSLIEAQALLSEVDSQHARADLR